MGGEKIHFKEVPKTFDNAISANADSNAHDLDPSVDPELHEKIKAEELEAEKLEIETAITQKEIERLNTNSEENAIVIKILEGIVNKNKERIAKLTGSRTYN